LQVRLPEAGAQPDEAALRETVEIEVTAEGGYRVGGRDLVNNSPDTLATALSRAAGGDRARVITIRADGRAVHQSVVTAMDVAGRLGYARINIATVHDGSQSR
jgi:biopolymer transport protein ExbD